jgi:hypothetical protein
VLLGYHQGRSPGPALLRAIVRRLHRDARTIPWDRVVRHDGEAVEVDLHRGDLGVRSGGERDWRWVAQCGIWVSTLALCSPYATA